MDDEMAKRGPGQRLTTAERVEFGRIAWELSARGYGRAYIANEIGVNPKTVIKLLEDEAQRKRDEWHNEDIKAIALYEELIREGFDLLKKKDVKANSYVVPGILNGIGSHRQRVDKITGVEAPTRSESDVNLNYRDYTTGSELTELFAEIDGYLETQDVQGSEVDSEESIHPSHPDL